jgi:hypothetical protein
MSPEHRTPGSVDPPEPDEVLASPDPRDEDDREVTLDDPALAELAIEDDPAPDVSS